MINKRNLDEPKLTHLKKEQYSALKEKGTEKSFTGKFCNHKDNKISICVTYKTELSDSNVKFDSEMSKTEVVCAKCKNHLDNILNDNSKNKLKKRFCINLYSLDFKKK